MSSPKRRQGLQREVVVPAASVELEVVLLDAVALAEALHGEVRLEAIGQDGAVHVGWSVAESREAAAQELDGENALERRAARIEVANGGAVECRRPRVGWAHRCRQVHDVAGRLGRGLGESGDSKDRK